MLSITLTQFGCNGLYGVNQIFFYEKFKQKFLNNKFASDQKNKITRKPSMISEKNRILSTNILEILKKVISIVKGCKKNFQNSKNLFNNNICK